MSHIDVATLPVMSVLIPASNEAELVGGCLTSILGSTWQEPSWVEVIVISNGSHDGTADVALSYAARFVEKGWVLRVLDRKEGGKLNALNAGDRVARGGIRVYLDADVEVSEGLIARLYEELNVAQPRYASGDLIIAQPKTFTTRAYRRIYQKVPFLQNGVPGAGVFAVNAPGRLRWDAFPDIISDDTFVRLSFLPKERIKVDAPYVWPLVEGWKNLVRVRKRQDAGVAEIAARFPHLMANDDKPAFPTKKKLELCIKDPIGFAVYAGVALMVRLFPNRSMQWSRGR